MTVMDSEKSSNLLKAFALLNALQKNLPDGSSIRETFVEEFHKALDCIQRAGFEVDEFRIPADKVTPTLYTDTDKGTVKALSREKFIDRAFLLTRMDYVLGFFSLAMQDPPAKIGFSKTSR